MNTNRKNSFSQTGAKDSRKKAKPANDIHNVDDGKLKDPLTSFISNTSYQDIHHLLATSYPEKTLAELKQPYKTLFGEGAESFHDDLSKISKTVGRVFYQETMLGQDQIRNIKDNTIPQDEWILLMTKILNNDDETVEFVAAADFTHAMLTMNRLAHSNPKTLFQDEIRGKQVRDTLAVRVWTTAVTLLGSWYEKPKTTKQTNLFDAFSKQLNEADSPKVTKPHNEKNPNSRRVSLDLNPAPPSQKTGTSAPPALKITKMNAEAAADGKEYTTRITLKFKLPKDENQTPHEHFLDAMSSVIREYRTNDSGFALLPYKDADQKRLPAITHESQLPKKVSEFRDYVDKCNPKAGSDCWFKIHVAGNGNHEALLCYKTSAACDLFEAMSGGAYEATVPDSDDPVEIGYLLYQGNYTDPKRMNQELRKECAKLNKGQLIKLGVRAKKIKDLPTTPGWTDWVMMDNQVIAVECHRPQAKIAKKALYQLFNVPTSPKTQIQKDYMTRMLPSLNMIRSGTKGSLDHNKMTRRHQGVQTALLLSRTTDIAYLDTPTKIGNAEYTLRQLLQKETFPLVPAKGEKAAALFHSMDRAQSGRDKGQGVTYFTYQKNRANVAEKLVSILPAFITFRYSEAVTRAFFHDTAIEDCPEITWVCTEENNPNSWTGDWRTEEDEQLAEMCNEDIGFEFDLSEMDTTETTKETVIDIDNLSFASFNTHLNGGRRTKHQHVGQATQADDQGAFANRGQQVSEGAAAL